MSWIGGFQRGIGGDCLGDGNNCSNAPSPPTNNLLLFLSAETLSVGDIACYIHTVCHHHGDLRQYIALSHEYHLCESYGIQEVTEACSGFTPVSSFKAGAGAQNF